MFIPKRYGESKKQDCPFCGKAALAQNMQGVPTCLAHKEQKLADMKCLCGSWLDLRQGDWGPYFNCTKCGNLSFSKGMARSTPTETKNAVLPASQKKPTHITIRSDDPLYFDD